MTLHDETCRGAAQTLCKSTCSMRAGCVTAVSSKPSTGGSNEEAIIM